MTVTPRTLAIAGVAILVATGLAFMGGRRSVPAKVVEKEKIVEKKVVDQEAIQKAVAEAHAEWSRSVSDHSIIRIVYRDGKPVERIVYRDREAKASGSSSSSSTTDTKVTGHTEETKVAEKTKTVEAPRPSWFRLSSSAFLPVVNAPEGRSAWKPDVEAEAELRLVGPLWADAKVVARELDVRKPEVRVGLKLVLLEFQ